MSTTQSKKKIIVKIHLSLVEQKYNYNFIIRNKVPIHFQRKKKAWKILQKDLENPTNKTRGDLRKQDKDESNKLQLVNSYT